MKFHLLLPLAGLVFSNVTEGAVVTSPIELAAFGFASRGFDFDGDGEGDLIFGTGGTICTADIPTSGCTSRLVVLGNGSVEFLLDETLVDFGAALNGGFVLSDVPAQGEWRTPTGGRLYLTMTTSQRFPDRDPYRPELMSRDDYLVGFRVRDSEGLYRYGWIDIQLQGDVIDLDGSVIGQAPLLYAREFYLEETAGVPVTVVPEPSIVSTASLALLAFAFRRKRKLTH